MVTCPPLPPLWFVGWVVVGWWSPEFGDFWEFGKFWKFRSWDVGELESWAVGQFISRGIGELGVVEFGEF